MRYVRGFEVLHCPRYAGPDEAARLEENLLVQRTLWSALRFLQVGESRLSVELRICADAKTSSLRIFLLLGAPVDHAHGPPHDVVACLLPEEYGWRALAPNDLRPDALVPDVGGRPWHVVRLARRLEFADLPSTLPWLATSGPDVADPGVGDAAPALGPGAARRLVRHLPLPGVPIKTQIKGPGLCLPVLGSMADLSPDRRRLCLEMQESSPVVLSLALHPIDPRTLEDAWVAAHLRQSLAPFRYAIAGAGFAELGELDRIYDRYCLPASHLCGITIRVAAADGAAALAVGHLLAGCLGGLRAFDVSPLRHTLPAVDRLADPTVGARSLAGVKQMIERRGVRALDSFLPFLGRMPDVFTLNEAEQVMRLPFALEGGLPGIATRPVTPFHPPAVGLVPDGDGAPADRVRLGRIASASKAATPAGRGPAVAERPHGPARATGWHTLPVADLCKHALIVGTTGSGKTVLTTFLLRELARLEVPFLVIEPVKTEYYDRLRHHIPGLRRRRFEGTPSGRPADDFLRFDPLRLQRGVSVARHVSYLKSCFQAAFPLQDVQALLLENGLRAYYTRPVADGGCGLSLLRHGGPRAHLFDAATGRIAPSFTDFSSFFLDRFLRQELMPDPASGAVGQHVSAYVYEWRQMFERRFRNLAEGPLGQSFRLADDEVRDRRDVRHYDPFFDLIKGPVILELDAIPDNEEKALVLSFLLAFLYERRQTEDLDRRTAGDGRRTKPLEHVLVVEEAHRLLSRDAAAGGFRGESVGQSPRGKAVSMFADMVAEIRAFGQGLVAVEQLPTRLVPELVKIANLKMMLRLTAEDDREFLGANMRFTEAQKRFVTALRPGEIVAFEENLDEPLLLELPADVACQITPSRAS